MAASRGAQDKEDDEGPSAPARNEVRLVGRLAAAAEERELPSGDRLVTWRLVVRRPPSTRKGAPTIDTIECAAYRGDVRRAATRWSVDDVVEVDGALRRRFWQTAAGAASRTEVEVAAARRVARA
ncbi:MAG TPA: single-stranded DNA-binding protein [Mycobacteriales bacterium]|nr:single-stranded DNA-binding protein [Mycobacteriales bacterium]